MFKAEFTLKNKLSFKILKKWKFKRSDIGFQKIVKVKNSEYRFMVWYKPPQVHCKNSYVYISSCDKEGKKERTREESKGNIKGSYIHRPIPKELIDWLLKEIIYVY